MVNMLHRKIRVMGGFDISKAVTSTEDKKEGKRHEKPPKNSKPKNSKMWNCKRCWTKMIRKHKNNSPNNWALVNKLFPTGHEKWERFRKSIDGYHVS